MITNSVYLPERATAPPDIPYRTVQVGIGPDPRRSRAWLESDLRFYKSQYRSEVECMRGRTHMFWHYARMAQWTRKRIFRALRLLRECRE